MKYWLRKYFVPFCLVFLGYSGCLVGQENHGTEMGYSYKDPGAGGTGKVYMGREIAGLMSFRGKDWLERDSRPEEENTDLAIENLPVHQGSVVADIGAGSGYYTFRIAAKVPDGKVYAVEIQDD